MGEVESVKSVNDIYAPIAGEVLEVNAAVVALFDSGHLGDDLCPRDRRHPLQDDPNYKRQK